MSEQSPKSGIIVSSLLHSALLAAVVVGFASAPKFDDSAESVPVETVTQDQFNQIMKGERDAKRSEKPVQPAEANAPTPPVEPAKTEPPPPQKVDEAAGRQPPQTAPAPPARPTPPVREAAAPATPSPDDAEVDRPQARTDQQTPPTPPSPPERPKSDDKPKTDQLAKLVADSKSDDQPKPAARPKSTETAHVFDPNAIAKLIGQSKQHNQEQTTSATPLGLPTQNAQRMSPSLEAALDGWLTDAYLRCWQPPPTMPDGEKYVAEVKVAFNVDGSLSTRPLLINPPSDPAWRAYAESAMRAVLKCNPLQVPPQYVPYFEQWKNKTVHFDPENVLG